MGVVTLVERGRNRWCLNETALPFPSGLPLGIDVRGVLDERGVGRGIGIFEGEGFLELGSEGILLVLEGDDDRERSATVG